MNSRLDPLLAELKREVLPALDADFAADVWRQIARRRQALALPWWTGGQHPRVALAAAAAAIMIGLATAWLLPVPRMSDRTALGLDAFAADAPHLPSSLIARR